MNKSLGFTLIELLVAVLIIGILAAVALPQYEKAVEKSRMAEALSIGKTLDQAMAVWVLGQGGYPMENVEFLGTNPGGELDIMLPLIPTTATESDSKYFRYEAWCGGYGSQYCRWWAWRLDKGYGLLHETIDGDDHYECWYRQEGLAETMCKLLEAQGWRVENDI